MNQRWWPAACTVALAAFLCADILWFGKAISQRGGSTGDWVLWSATAWLALCVAGRGPFVPVPQTPSSWALVAVSVAALPTGLLLGSGTGRGSVLGEALILVSACLYAWAAAALGRHFALFPAALGLTTDGPYRFVRHPFYAAYMLGSLGILLTRPDPVLAAAVMVEAVALAMRARVEERILIARLPGYAEYRSRTAGAFAPRRRPRRSSRPREDRGYGADAPGASWKD